MNSMTKEIYINTEGMQIQTFQNNAFFDLSPNMFLYRGTQMIFRCHLLLADAVTPFVVPSDAALLFGIDSSFTVDHPDLVVSNTTSFNISGDWQDISPAEGKICWRVDLATTELKEDLGTDISKTMYAYLWMTPSGGSPTLLAQWDVTVRNIAVDPTTVSPVAGVSYPYTTKLWNPTQNKWQVIGLTGAAGAEQITIAVGTDS